MRTMDPSTDAVGIVRDAVASAMPEVGFTTTVPDPPPRGAHVMGWVQSATERDFVYRPQVALVCWGSSDASAMALAMDCAAAVQRSVPGHPSLSQASVSSLSRDEFAPGGAARYRLLLDLVINE